LTVHLPHEIMWNVNLMQQGNFIDIFLARHVSGTRHHPHRTHNLPSGSQDHHPSKNSVQKTTCCNSTANAPGDWAYVRETCRAKNISIKLPCCIKLAFNIISCFCSDVYKESTTSISRAQVDYEPDTLTLKIYVAPSSETSEYLLHKVGF